MEAALRAGAAGSPTTTSHGRHGRGDRPDRAGRLRWHVRRAWARTAWPEFLAVATIGFAIGLALWVNRPLRREVAALQAAAAAVAPTGATPVAPASAQLRADAAFVEGLMAFLPASEVREQQLHTLHGLAVESGVELARAEYGHGNLQHLPGQRMTMQLMLAGEYAAYRKFLHKLLAAMPNLAVDRVTLEKAPGQAASLSIRLEASLYYRNDAGREAPPGAGKADATGAVKAEATKTAPSRAVATP